MDRKLWIIVACGIGIVIFGGGLRQTFGIYLRPISVDLELSRQFFGFILATQALVYGLAQPIAGLLADRYGSIRTIICCTLIYAIGLWWAGFSQNPNNFVLSLGVLVGIGLTGPNQVLVLGIVGKVTPTERRSLIFGSIIAAQSIGMFLLVPSLQQLLSTIGWRNSLAISAIVILLLPLLCIGLYQNRKDSFNINKQPLSEAILEARSHSGYLLLTAGFFVCGFHVTFIAVHLPSFLIDQKISATIASYSLGLIGLFNVAGAYLFGALGDRWSKKNLLTIIYSARALVMALILIIPIDEVTAIAFGIAMGLLWLATVPLTSSIVAQIFGTQYFSLLFGIVMMSHQFGAFIGAWLGGFIYDKTGSYDLMWVISAGLGLLAACIHWPIREAPIERLYAK